MLADGSRVLRSLRDWVRWGASRFEEAGLWYGHGTDNALSESLALVLHALHLPHALSVPWPNHKPTSSKRLAPQRTQSRNDLSTRLPSASIALLPC